MKITAILIIPVIFFVVLTVVLIVRANSAKNGLENNSPSDSTFLEKEVTEAVSDSSITKKDLNEEVTTRDDTISETPNVKGAYLSPPPMILKPNTNYVATLKTNKGDISIDLFADKTPITVNNFVFLANEGFFDQTKSHRIIQGFMVQFGDPLTKDDSKKDLWGSGGPGYKFDDEPFDGDYNRGIVAMANSGPNTNGSQFFIMHQNTSLPPNYVIFGEVTEASSLEVLDTIAATKVAPNKFGEVSVPQEDIVVESVSILEE